MTVISFSDFQEGYKHKNSINVCGHAGYDIKGKDIVCASISTLIFAFIENLEFYHLEYDCEMKEGNIFISYEHILSPRYAYFEEFLYTALKMIEREFPEYLSVN